MVVDDLDLVVLADLDFAVAVAVSSDGALVIVDFEDGFEGFLIGMG